MQFEDFARGHGLIINSVQHDRWIPTPTLDHPRSSNGRYKFLGNVGWVQNWATMEKPATWFAEGENASSSVVRERIAQSNKTADDAKEKAAKKAGWILNQTTLATHPYLASKGFPDEQGNVWEKDGEKLLVIPMRIATKLVGVQIINEQGEKKFLYGQQSKGATFCMNAKGIPMFCEGYATGLSIREVMKSCNIKYCIHVCFSASNMKLIAGYFPNGIIISDNDNSGVGQATAMETGKPYWISPTVGEDFNDYHQRVGNFRASQSLKKIVTPHVTM
jgi:putative DNA primase/helicase